MNHRCLLVLAGFFLWLGHPHSQPLSESYFVRVPGLKTSVIYCIQQDRLGYIWIGTDAGVARYDGYEFIFYTTADGLSDNEVFQIREDQQGRLWFLTYNGRLSIYDHGRILNAGDLPALNSIAAGSMSMGWAQQGDSIWYVSRQTAYLFVKDQLKIRLPARELLHVADAAFADIVRHNNTFLLISTKGIYDPAGKHLTHFPDGEPSLPVSKTILCSGNLFYHNDNYLLKYNIGQKQFSRFSSPDGEPISAVHYQAASGLILLATSKTVFTFNPDNNQFIRLFDASVPFSCYLYADRYKNFWMASQNQGLWIHRPNYVHSFLPQTDFQTIEAYTLGQSNGHIYAGFINGEFMEWKNGRAHWRNSLLPAGLNKTYGFESLRGELFALAGSRLIEVTSGKSILYPGSVKAIATKGDTAYVGLSFSVNAIAISEILTRDKLNAEKLSGAPYVYNKRVYSLLVNSDTLWLGSDEGLFYYTGTGVATAYPVHHPVLKSKVTKIVATTTGALLFSTAGRGVGVVKNGACFTIDINQGLSSNNCNSLFTDSDSTIWVATDRGISRICYQWTGNRPQCRIKNYSARDGLPSDVVNDILVQSDTVWLATNRGVSYFREDSIQHSAPPDIIIEQVFVNGNIRKPFTFLQLASSENNLRIDFTALSFSLQNNTEYAYMLEGADTSWSYSSARRIQYSNLAPGQYTFRVVAGNPYTATGKIQTFSFHIRQPFWKSQVFIIACILFAIVIATGITLLRIRSIRKKHLLEQTALQLNKEKAELEQKAAALQMNPHFVFNAMNAIKGYYASGDMEGGHNYISRFAGLMRMILEKNALPLISLQDEITMLNLYLELAALQRPGKFDYKITSPEIVAPQKIWFPPMLIQPFVENAVLHGVAPLTNGGMIWIDFELEDDMLVCRIKDNGVGLQKSAGLNRYKLHSSKGINITRQRLQLLHANSQLSVTEYPDQNGKVAGTIAMIRFPVLFKNL